MSKQARPAFRRGGAVRRAAVLVVAVLMGASAPALVTAPARADTAPVPPPVVPTVSADALPTVQINGVAWAQVVVGNRVYVTGSFTRARPAGAAPGTDETPRLNILAYDLTTGALITSWAPTLNAPGLALAASSDGTRIYVAGDFTSVSDVARNRIAALDAATGALIADFNASANSRVKALAVSENTLYAGGNFTITAGLPRQRLAAFDATTGAVLGWAPGADQSVWALTVPAGSGRVIAGGSFTTLNRQSARGSGALDAATGATLPWAVNSIVYDYGSRAAIYSLSNDGKQVYGTGYNFGGVGNLENTFAATVDGALVWVSGCRGDTYSSVPLNGVVYNVGHAHDCRTVGSFPEQFPQKNQRAIAYTATPAADGAVNTGGNFSGRPIPDFLHWEPTVAAGTYTGQSQGAWSLHGNSQYLVMGGEFPRVNGVAQQGLTRFAVRSLAPNLQGPQDYDGLVPSATGYSAGTVRLSWKTSFDRDNRQLTYEVLRGEKAKTATVLKAVRAESSWWDRPTVGFIDRTATPGSSQTYRIRVRDALGNTLTGPTRTVTVPSGTAPASPYSDVLVADDVTNQWRLGESGGGVGYDWASGNDLSLSWVTRGMTGALAGDADRATRFPGGFGVFGATKLRETAPHTFSLEAWFSTTTTSGGKLIGFGDTPTSDSSRPDRHVYMTNTGRLVFGVRNKTAYTVTSPSSYNDGRWHHVVATLGPAGQRLYVDGNQVAERSDSTTVEPRTGYWRVGGDSLSGWPDQPRATGFAGTLDEVATYSKALSPGQVKTHYTVGTKGAGAAPKLPADEYGAAVWDSQPDLYLRLDETSGTSALDTMTAQAAGTYSPGVMLGQAGSPAAASGKSITLPGTESTVVATTLTRNPTVFSLETWFRTTTTTGGRIIGFGNAPSGTSSACDRMLYMLDTGQLRYGIRPGQQVTIDSPARYNDGAWHHVVVTQDSSGQRMYVDGAPVASGSSPTPQAYDGYWRLGSDCTWGGASTNHFAGSLDEVAVYPTVLPAATVQAHHAFGVPARNVPPTARFTASANALAVSVDAAGSTDADGTITSYSWDFGDGTTGTGVTRTHAYAAPGTYSVKLTVTDNGGVTGTVAHEVTATAGRTTLVADSFARVVTGGWGTAETGGAWSLSSGATNYDVSNGGARIRMPAAGSSRSATLPAVSSSTTDLTVKLAADKAATGNNGIFVSAIGRRTAGGDYRGRLRILSTGAVAVGVTRVTGGAETVIGREVTLPGVTSTPGTALRLRMQAEGTGTTTLRLKVWLDGGDEPAAWQVVQTDTTAGLQNAGSIGVATYLSGSATNAPIIVTFGDLKVTTI
jgi:PKD repeat protein